MVMTGRAMTGAEAVSANLATGLVWSASAYEELIALARQMLDNAAQVRRRSMLAVQDVPRW